MIRKKIIDNFFNFLSGKVKYAILTKNTQLYSEQNDIDIITDSFVSFKNAINLYLKKKNINIVQEINHRNYGKHIFFVIQQDSEFISFNIDLYEVIAFNNKIIFQASFLLKSRIKNKYLYFLNKNKISIYYFIKNLIKNNFSYEHIAYIRQNLNARSNYFKIYFPISYNQIIKNIHENNHKFFLKERHNLFSELLNNSSYFFYHYFFLFAYYFKRTFYQNGLIIAFVGPDGSGKSSLIKKIRYSQLPFRNIYYYHFSPNTEFNPFDKNLFIMNRKRCHNLFISYLKLLYILLTFIIFYPLIIIKKIKSSLIIFDRYYYDLVADSNRFRIKENMLISLLIKFIPKPDLVFVLSAKPLLIYSRKPENSLFLTKKLLKNYQLLLDKYNFIKISTNNNINYSHKNVLSKIYKELIKKNEK